ncbi:GMC oxidoreductase [Calothrix sp. 336/3]|uniref:GMC oxidoreductase n=1 Tax=Calothrix sp. 336/3 TaxID=1337936 RepID=UPI0004E2EA8A|nr:GMC oxidoreductase [Calothrix sp. 336/3]AKG24885.1 cholesterol oxidase [Calothrix sp. 336/3]
MSQMLNRRRFLQASAAAAASIGVSTVRTWAGGVDEYVEAIVIGSGFGGAVASLRLGQAGIETVVLERGRRWQITDAGNTFSTTNNPDGRSTWLSPTTVLPPPVPEIPIDVYTGVLDVKRGNGINAYRGAGVGGTSLVYGGITYQPTEELFYKVFPRTIKYSELDRVYYPRVRSILKASPIPDDILQTKYYLASRILQEQAAKAGLQTRKIDIAFDWDIVRQEISNQKVASVIAGQIYYGTNSGAKNSLDRNYLSMAEATGNVEIRPLHVVTMIGESDRGRYRVVCNQINEQGEVLFQKSFVCRYLFLAAGSIGTTELLLRAKTNRTLRRLNNHVGKFWGTNSDSNTVMINAGETNPTLGTPGVIAVEHLDNPIAPVVLEPFQSLPFIPQGLIPVLGQGISQPEGYLTFNTATQSSDLFWPINSADSQKNAQALQYTYQRLNLANSTSLAAPPDYSSTAHPLGGATVGRVCNTHGQVFGYPNLFIVDGSFIPGSTACSNPSLTIAALAERSMDHFLNWIPRLRKI